MTRNISTTRIARQQSRVMGADTHQRPRQQESMRISQQPARCLAPEPSRAEITARRFLQQPTTARRQDTQLADTVAHLPMESWCATDDR